MGWMRPKAIVGLLFLLILLFGCVQPQPGPGGNPAANNTPAAGDGTADYRTAQAVKECETAGSGREVLNCYEGLLQQGPYGPAVCEAASTKAGRQTCYVAYAATSNDVAGICSTNRLPADRDECFYAFGARNNNASDCDFVQGEVMRGGCYGTVAAATGDAQLCQTRSGASATVSDACYALLGGMTRDAAACEKVQNESLRENCKSFIAQAGQAQ